jgi:uncharacterized protein YndB with AHSA1/START domain
MTEKGSSSAEDSSGRKLVITRILDAPRELVFEAWTDPKHVSQWFGPRGFSNPVCELDPRPGGSILIHMRGPNGISHPMTGVYHEVVRPTRLVYTSWVPDKENPLFEILTTVTFAELGGKTKLTLEAKVLKSTPEAAPMLAGMEEGWKQTLDRLTEHVGRR